MTPYFTDTLLAAPRAGAYADEYRVAEEFIDMLTGKQTIYQCMRLADEVAARGGEPLPAAEYKAEYLRRLDMRIRDRKAALQNGAARPDDYTVTGAAQFLSALSAHMPLYLASGTDEKDVRYEAGLLDVVRYFERIHGATDDTLDCSKEAVINSVIAAQAGGRLLGFGDGYVEIELIKRSGGYAVAVATDEQHRGRIDRRKRKRLLEAGADACVPDFRHADKLLEFLGLIK